MQMIASAVMAAFHFASIYTVMVRIMAMVMATKPAVVTVTATGQVLCPVYRLAIPGLSFVFVTGSALITIVVFMVIQSPQATVLATGPLKRTCPFHRTGNF